MPTSPTAARSVAVSLTLTSAAGRRRLRCPSGLGTRPTPAKVREAVFHRMGRAYAGEAVLDVCAGSGTLGLEALGRNARLATFIESQPQALQALRHNVTAFAGRAEVLAGDARHWLPRLQRRGRLYDLIFVDPPYALNLWPQLLAPLSALPLLAADGYVFVEYPACQDPPAAPVGLQSWWQRAFGAVAVVLMRWS